MVPQLRNTHCAIFRLGYLCPVHEHVIMVTSIQLAIQPWNLVNLHNLIWWKRWKWSPSSKIPLVLFSKWGPSCQVHVCFREMHPPNEIIKNISICALVSCCFLLIYITFSNTTTKLCAWQTSSFALASSCWRSFFALAMFPWAQYFLKLPLWLSSKEKICRWSFPCPRLGISQHLQHFAIWVKKKWHHFNAGFPDDALRLLKFSKDFQGSPRFCKDSQNSQIRKFLKDSEGFLGEVYEILEVIWPSSRHTFRLREFLERIRNTDWLSSGQGRSRSLDNNSNNNNNTNIYTGYPISIMTILLS